ncbi:hypothetical protein [Pseudoxanthomonas winnipegensis]|uniref:hypothetical protein n=1 Tax=Pseudoxanthomonas winnipegensis TaxID=2480810 RepID=UPI0030F42EB0
MSADFEAIVGLCRRSVSCELDGAQLRVQIAINPEVVRLEVAAAAYRQPDIFVEGHQRHAALSTFAEGTLVELRFDGLTSNSKVIAGSLDDLIAHQQGLFLYRAPPEYFLLQERYASGDDYVPPLVQAYQRLPKLFELLESVADVVLESGSAKPSFVFLAGKRMDIPATYKIEALQAIPDPTDVESLAVEILAPPLVDAKKSIFKKALIRILESSPQESRFTGLVKRFDAIRQAFSADFELYSTEFNFEKIREGFEQKRLAFVLQLNGTTTDLLGKMLAIPVGQGLIVSQLKNEPTAAIGNSALMLGSLIFATFAGLLIFNHHQSLKQIKLEIKLEKEALEMRFPQLFKRIEEMFAVLSRRAALHTWAFPAVVAILLATTTAYSIYAFLNVPPNVSSDRLVLGRSAATEKPIAEVGRASAPADTGIRSSPSASVAVASLQGGMEKSCSPAKAPVATRSVEASAVTDGADTREKTSLPTPPVGG